MSVKHLDLHALRGYATPKEVASLRVYFNACALLVRESKTLMKAYEALCAACPDPVLREAINARMKDCDVAGNDARKLLAMIAPIAREPDANGALTREELEAAPTIESMNLLVSALMERAERDLAEIGKKAQAVGLTKKLTGG